MAEAHERFSEQFRKWEQRGRGWRVFDEPVWLEPPFRPFRGHYLRDDSVIDDGRRPTFLSSLVKNLSRKLSTIPPEPPTTSEPEEEPEPNRLTRDALVELPTSLPTDLEIAKEAYEQFLLNISLCKEPVAFELLGLENRVTAQFVAHPDDAPLVRRQLEAHFPEATFQPRESTLEQAWDSCAGDEMLVAEFGLAREFMFALATGKLDPFVGMVGALAELDPNEFGLFQVLFESARKPWAENIIRSVTDEDGKPFFVDSPELTTAAEKKVAHPLYAAVVRIATKAEVFDRALQIARDMTGSLRVFANPQGNELIPLKNETDEYPMLDHVEDMLRRQSRRSGMLLTSEELIGFVHLPGSAVRSTVLERDSGKTKAAPALVRNAKGLLLGNNIHCGETIPVRLTPEQRVYHTHIIGATGTGKSTLLFNLIRQDIESGQGVAVLDPHGDLVDRILGIIPPHRIADVVLVDPSDPEYSVGFNILSAHTENEKNLLASDLVSVFKRLSTSWGDQMQSVLQNAVLAFLDSDRKGTLADMRRFLVESSFRAEFLKSVSDPNVLYYWQKGFPILSGNKSVGPIVTRLDMFLAQRPIAHMVSQPENRLDFAGIMDGGKIFLAKLPEGLLGRENSYLLGAVLVSKFQQLVMSRQAQQISARRDFWIYIDEFANFITPTMAEILSGARKYRIGLTLAHHELHQLERDAEVASAVRTHPFTRIVFRVGDEDAKKLAESFSFFESSDLKNLETGHAVARVERSSFDFNLSVILPDKADEAETTLRRQEVITASRKKYGKLRSEIEAALRAQLETEAPKNEAPPIKQRVKPLPMPSEPPLVPCISEIPKVPEPIQQPVIEQKVSLEPAIILDLPKPSDKGIGGHQHNLIRERIEAVGRELGYTASREEYAPDTRDKIDVTLRKPNRAIACEIAITTTIDHEVGNVAKCLKLGFDHIAVITPSPDRLEKIRMAVAGSLPPQQSISVGYYHPDRFIEYLRESDVKSDAPIISSPGVTTFGKYKIKHTMTTLTPEELKERESVAYKLLAETMRKKKRE